MMHLFYVGSWSNDGTKVFSGGCDNIAKVWQLANGSSLQVAQHEAPIKSVHYFEELQVVVTGSWDKTLKYWDSRQPGVASSAQLPEKVYCMDVVASMICVGTADRQILIYDVRKPNVEFRRFTSPLKYQSKCLAAFHDRSGFALGSIEGRVAIQYVEEKDSQKNFAFRCQRDGNDIYAVNVLTFHPYGTFATAGSDGTYNFWDKDLRQRLKPFAKCQQPISAGCFNHDGSIFAYAVSYDWSKGHEYYNPMLHKNYIFLHTTNDNEVKSRSKGTTSKR